MIMIVIFSLNIYPCDIQSVLLTCKILDGIYVGQIKNKLLLFILVLFVLTLIGLWMTVFYKFYCLAADVFQQMH